MRRLWVWVTASLLLAPGALAAPAGAAEVVKQSGTIVDIAPDARTFVLAGVGPWRTRDGETVVTRRTIALTRDTTYVFAARAERAPSGFPGDFVETPVGPEHVYLHDHVTVESRHDGKRWVALKITVTEPTAAAEGAAAR